MTTLVTGAAGFIGFHVASELIKSGKKVVLVDNFNSYYPTSLKLLRESVLHKEFGQEIIRLDLAEKDEVLRLFSNNSFEGVIHLAAQAGIRIPISESSLYVHSNLIGFSNLASISAQMDLPQVIYASSSSVYGNSTPAPYREDYLPLKPVSFYGATKLSNEILADTIANSRNTKFTGLRFFTAYGPLGRPDMAYFRIATALLHNQSFQLYGNGSAKRDFTYVEDIVEAIMRIYKLRLQSNGLQHEIYNIGGGAPHSILDLIEKFETISERRLTLEIKDKVAADVEKTISDTTKLKRDTGFVPTISLDEGISRFMEWGLQPEINNQLPLWIKN